MQIFVNGVITGLTFAVLALAFAVVYIPSRVFHFALGAVYVAGPFVAWACLQRGWSMPLAIVAALLVALGLSLACELLNHWRLEKKGAASSTHFIASLGSYIIIVQAVVLLWGTETKVLRTGLDEAVTVGSVVVTKAQLVAAGVSIVALAAFYTWLRFTKFGLRFRALAENPSEFALRGYSVRQARLLAFGISGLLTAASSLVVANDVGFDPNGGLAALLLAVVAVFIGGRMTFAGAALGGLLLGVVRSEVVWFLSARWQEAITFVLLVLFLFLRPNGIIGKADRLEAEA